MKDLNKVSEVFTTFMALERNSVVDGLLDEYRKREEAAKPYRWQLKSEEELSSEQHGKYRLVTKRLTWSPPEKEYNGKMAFAAGPVFGYGSKPDGLDENGAALRFYVYGDEHHDFEYHIRGERASADELLAWLQRRDERMPKIERAIAVFKENGFHHGEYYSPCEQSVKCSQCVEAAMDVLGLAGEKA